MSCGERGGRERYISQEARRLRKPTPAHVPRDVLKNAAPEGTSILPSIQRMNQRFSFSRAPGGIAVRSISIRAEYDGFVVGRLEWSVASKGSWKGGFVREEGTDECGAWDTLRIKTNSHRLTTNVHGHDRAAE